jgi:hypothetical protein
MLSNTSSIRLPETPVVLPAITGNDAATVTVPFPGVKPGDTIIVSPPIQIIAGEGNTVLVAGGVAGTDEFDLTVANTGVAWGGDTLNFKAVAIRATGSV